MRQTSSEYKMSKLRDNVAFVSVLVGNDCSTWIPSLLYHSNETQVFTLEYLDQVLNTMIHIITWEANIPGTISGQPFLAFFVSEALINMQPKMVNCCHSKQGDLWEYFTNVTKTVTNYTVPKCNVVVSGLSHSAYSSWNYTWWNLKAGLEILPYGQ